MKLSKKNILVSGFAVILAAAMIIGSATFAYLQDSTEDVVNNFETNKVTVALTETTGENYDILPGTSQAKDPKVTVTSTIDSYVYVEVTDATGGLVKYEIADGWTKLEGYDNVYFREVTASDIAQEFYVLKDNTVAYDAALTNSDMVDAEGNLKEGISLTFKAYAIQAEPFANAVDAYYYASAKIVSSSEDLVAAVNNVEDGDNIVLMKDIEIAGALKLVSENDKPVSATLDLNGNTISAKTPVWSDANNDWALISAGANVDLTIKGNGVLKTIEDDSFAVDVRDGGKITINGGTYIGNVHAVYVYEGELTVNGGTFSVQQKYSAARPNDYVLNCYDANYGNGTAKITVNGGVFAGFNPADCYAEGEHTNFTSEGSKLTSVTDKDGITWYTVNAVAVGS